MIPVSFKSLTALIENHSKSGSTQEPISSSKVEQCKPLIRTIQKHILYEQDDIHVEPATAELHRYCPVYFSDVEKIFRHCSFQVCAYCEHSHRHSHILNICSVNRPSHALKEKAQSKAFGITPSSTLHRTELPVGLGMNYPVSCNVDSDKITTIDPSVPSSEVRKHDSIVAGSDKIREENADQFVKLDSIHLFTPSQSVELFEDRVETEIVPLVHNSKASVSISEETVHSDLMMHIQEVMKTPDHSTTSGSELIPEELDEHVIDSSVQVVKPRSEETACNDGTLSQEVVETPDQPTVVQSAIMPEEIDEQIVDSSFPVVDLHSEETACTDGIPSQEVVEMPDPPTVAESGIMPICSEVVKLNSHQSSPKISETVTPLKSKTASFEERTVSERVSSFINKISPAASLSEVTTDSDADAKSHQNLLSCSNMESEDSESDPEFLFSPLKPMQSRMSLSVKESPTPSGNAKHKTTSNVQRYFDQLMEEHNKEEYLKKLVSDGAAEFSNSQAGEVELDKQPLTNLPLNRMDCDPPGLQIFDISKVCHFFDSMCICLSNQSLPTEGSSASAFEKKLLSLPADILLHFIESRGLESCAISSLSEMTKSSLLKFLWRIMAVSEKYVTVVSCQRLIFYVVCELKNKWSPSLVDIAAILLNLGATTNGCPLKELFKTASLQLDKEFPTKISTREVNNPEQVFQNLRSLLQILASLIGQSTSTYSSLESAHFVLLMCWLSLDHKLSRNGFKQEIQSCIREGLDKIKDQDWPEQLEYLCKELVLVGKDHHNLSWMATFFPPSTRGLQLQRSFSFSAIQILVDEEPAFCYQVLPQDILQFLRRRKIDHKLDRHLLYSFFQLLNMSISMRILQQDEKTVEELANSIMETFAVLRDNPGEVETTYVKTLLVGIRTKWMCLVNSSVITKAYCKGSSSLSSDSS